MLEGDGTPIYGTLLFFFFFFFEESPFFFQGPLESKHDLGTKRL